MQTCSCSKLHKEAIEVNDIQTINIDNDKITIYKAKDSSVILDKLELN